VRVRYYGVKFSDGMQDKECIESLRDYWILDLHINFFANRTASKCILKFSDKTFVH